MKKKEEKVEGATPLEDVSGLLMPHAATREELNALEFLNISQVVKKYLLRKPSKRLAPFNYEWFLRTHREWQWKMGEIIDEYLPQTARSSDD